MENVISALRLLSMFDKEIGGSKYSEDDDPQIKPVANWHDETDLDQKSNEVSGYKPPPPFENPEPPVTGSVPTEKVQVGGVYENPEPPVTGSYPGSDEKSSAQQLIEAMQPRHRFTDKLYGLIDQMPMKDPNPSIKKRLLQGLFAGVTGDIEGSDRAVNRQYYTDLDRWRQQVGATQIGAKAEDSQADNYRMLALGGMRNQTAEAGLEIRRQEYERKVEKDKNDLEISRGRLELQRAALQNPSYEFIQGDDEYVYGFDRKRNAYHKFPIKGKDLDYETKQLVNLKNAEILARLRSSLNMDEDRAKERARESNPESATQRKVELYNRAHEYMAKHPEMARYVTLGAPGTNDFDIEVPAPNAWFNRGPDKQKYDEMIRFIFDEHGPIVPSNPAPASPNVNPRTPVTSGATAPTTDVADVVYMMAPDGVTVGRVKKAREQEFQLKGYKTVPKPPGVR